SVANATPRVIDALDLPLDTTGVVVIGAKGISRRLGLERGDVVLGVNGQGVADASDFAALVSRPAPGWDLRLLRNGRQMGLRLQG
ncbi:MAG: serine protease, partial [Pseudomonadota bacterium]